MNELEMELSLLREENARLKVERHRPPDAGRVIERMRDLGREHPAEERDGEIPQPDRAGQATTECLAMRDGLIAACQEVQQAIQEIRGRLGALSVDLYDGAGDRARPTRIAASGIAASDAQEVEEVDMELSVAARTSSSLAQNAA